MNKKIKNSIALVLICALAATGLSACSHEHDVSKWVVETEATCTTAGKEVGICAICGEEVEREIPIDEDNHVYGDWEIVTYPTETRSGTAKKVCTLNSEHDLIVSLPVLSSNLYTTSVVTRPTATTDGVRSFSYYHELGNIEFTTTISSSGITSVMDAVEVACDDVSHAAVRSGTGTVSNTYYESGRDYSSHTSYGFSYEYGENYTHIDDTESDSKERWYGIDSDGEIYGYRSDNGGTPFEETKTTSGSEYYIYGYRYIFVYATYVGTYYGTENFVLGLYNAAKLNENGDFEESSSTSGGETYYTFSYGKYSVTGTSGGYFSQIEVTFSLSDEYTIKSCTATCTCYVNNSDDDSNTWEIGEDGYAKVTSPTGMRYVSAYTIDQVTKTEDPVEPVNPYDADSMRISSYDIIYNDQIDANGNYVEDNDIYVTDDTIITVTATEATRASYNSGETTEDGDIIYNYANAFRIENIQPSNMADNLADDLTFYYREYSGSSYVDYEIDYSTGGYTNVGISCRLDSSTNTFFITSNISGYVDIVLKTHKTETVIHLYVTPVAPETLFPMLYEYSTTGYTWSSTYSTAVSGTVYAGQNLYFSSAVNTTESKYADNAYTATVTGAVDAAGSAISSEYYTLTDELTFNGQTMSAFCATMAGTYTITLVSVRDESIVSTITVTVEEVPERGELFSGSYVARLDYDPKGTVTVTFEAGESDGVYYATITSPQSTEVLRCYYDGETLTTSHYSGAENGFTLTFNEAYDLVISHSTGYYDDEEQTYIMETEILTKSS